MPIVASVSDFLEVARKSNQIDNTRLDDFVQGNNLPSSPRKLAALLVRSGLLTTFQAEQFLMGKHKGFTLGGYRIIERLGTGGAGAVYLAEHELMRRHVAIKVLPTPLADDPPTLERFRIEAQAAGLLDHPNIVHLYDFRQDGRLYYLVMEYVDGPNLQQLITRKGAVSVPLACEYIRQAALGLQHAHDRGMVHRDVKPANILVDALGVVKVLDLGLARVERDDSDSITRKFNSGTVMGTADYVAPEQALSLHDVDRRADIYSLGATLYALIAGRPPFDGGTIGQKLMWHQTRDPERLDSIRPEVPEELAGLVTQMLAKQPENRPQTMTAIAEALATWADSGVLEQERASSRSLAEIRFNESERLMSSATRRLLPNRPEVNTLVANGEQDTAKIEDSKKPVAPRRKPHEEKPVRKINWALVMLGGVVALAAGVIGGITSFLLWGPKI